MSVSDSQLESAASLAKEAGKFESAIRIRGAREHNLKNIDVDLPRNKLVVITGVSGSGKSSLAFDTLLAEGQRQYIDSLSVYARQFFDQRQRPDVERIEGLQPAIAIDQSQGSHSPRSTVGTVTEIADYMRLLYARAGKMACAECGEPISQQAPEEIEQVILDLPLDSRAMLLAPLVRGRKGKHTDTIEQARQAGFVRIRLDGLTYPIEDLPELKSQKVHNLEAVVDRLVIRKGIEERVRESVRLALKHGEGVVQVVYQTREEKEQQDGSTSNGSLNGAAAAYNLENGWHERLFNTRYACPKCKTGVAEVEARTFSFNSPYGACPTCDGMGEIEGFDPELVLPNHKQSITGGAIAPWRELTAASRKKRLANIEPWLAQLKVDLETPLSDWPNKSLQIFLNGNGKNQGGLLLLLEEEFSATKQEKVLDRLQPYRGKVICSDCEGSRLRPEARSCRINDLPIHEVSAMSVSAASDWFADVSNRISEVFAEDRQIVAEPLLAEINRRLAFLRKSGVGYLSLDRAASTLSGGELQRVRLATGIGSGLVGVMYLLDEPSIGLHPRDNDRLISALRDLQKQGNSVIVVEHDEALMHSADWLIDVGPRAGALGGEVVSEGSPDEVSADDHSITGQYLSGKLRIETPKKRRLTPAKAKPSEKAVVEPPKPMLTVTGATLHNLKGDPLKMPLGKLVGVTGVSGSGKTSLIVGTLARALARDLNGAAAKPGPFEKITGLEAIDRFVQVDQSPIGRSPRSNAATYTGLFDEVRKLFAKTKLARQRGYKIGRFSFNVKGGRCEECQGQGQKKIEMNFLPDLYVTCDTCAGKRFNRQTLSVLYKGHSIADVLEMPIDSALELMADVPTIQPTLEALSAVGLGYLSLGQPSNTLSGGEAQRIKLASELGSQSAGRSIKATHTLYLLDEPTTGLHADDVKRLLGVLNRLVDSGNTVVVIEHHLDVMRCADWLIDLGPTGGNEGGHIIASGSPEHLATIEASHTGKWLAEALS